MQFMTSSFKPEREVRPMKRRLRAMVGVFAIVLAVAMPTSARATVTWVCEVPGEGTVTFVSVPDAAHHGIETANAHAGQTFNRKFGEVCTVVEV